MQRNARGRSGLGFVSLSLFRKWNGQEASILCAAVARVRETMLFAGATDGPTVAERLRGRALAVGVVGALAFVGRGIWFVGVDFAPRLAAISASLAGFGGNDGLALFGIAEVRCWR